MRNNKLNVFVSYTVRDKSIDKEFLIQLEKSLKLNYNIFIDLIHNDSENKQARIENELADSDCIILLKTKLTFYSQWVRKEMDLAKELKIPIFEFEFEDIKHRNFLPIKQVVKLPMLNNYL